MSPKSLTTLEKNLQRDRLIMKGRELLAAYGVRKTSVEDIAKAAGMAKGSFYQHFESKEAFFFELIVQFHALWFQRAGEFFAKPSGEPLADRVRTFIRLCFHSPEYLSIFKYREELNEVIQAIQAVSQEKVDALMEMEHESYDRLLKLYRMDTKKVKPGVIHNYLHTIYFGVANAGLMENDCMDDTFEALLDGLIAYIFGGGA